MPHGEHTLVIDSIDEGRRAVLGAGAIVCLSAFRNAQAMDGHGPTPAHKEAEREGGETYNVHEGKGLIRVKFFDFDRASRPALLLTYTIPPGCSEGVHVHRPGDKQLGSFDEFYYIIEGSGSMEISGERIQVAQGDHVFTPNGVAHGIENTSDVKNLKVYLVAMMRD